MYAVLSTPDVVALVDSNDRERWALFGTSTDTAELWRDRLNAGTYDRDALVWTRTADHDYRADLSPVDPRIAELRARIERLNAQVTRLSGQISGDDHRLTDFWEQAHKLADDAGHCEVFDDLCDALGGPTRTVDVNVTISLTFSATMSRADYRNGNYDDIDPSDYVDTYAIQNATIDDVSEA